MAALRLGLAAAGRAPAEASPRVAPDGGAQAAAMSTAAAAAPVRAALRVADTRLVPDTA